MTLSGLSPKSSGSVTVTSAETFSFSFRKDPGASMGVHPQHIPCSNNRGHPGQVRGRRHHSHPQGTGTHEDATACRQALPHTPQQQSCPALRSRPRRGQTAPPGPFLRVHSWGRFPVGGFVSGRTCRWKPHHKIQGERAAIRHEVVKEATKRCKCYSMLSGASGAGSCRSPVL